MARLGEGLRAGGACALAAVVMAAGTAWGGAAAPAASGASPRSLAQRYLAIAEAGNRRLEHDFDSLEGRDRDNLGRARADLADAAATERLFDRRLRGIRFPAAIEAVAQRLYRINEKRATLTAAAAVATTLAHLRSYEPVLDAANVPVEQAVAELRRMLGLPPPETS